jgi:hypothetical protein
MQNAIVEKGNPRQLPIPRQLSSPFQRPSRICHSERSDLSRRAVEESTVRHSGAPNLPFYNYLQTNPRSLRLIFRPLLPHLRQCPAIPDSDGDSTQSSRSGEQQPGAPEILLLRNWWNPARRLVYGDWFAAIRSQFSKGHGDLGKS